MQNQKKQTLCILTQIVDENDPILGFFHGWILEFAKHFAEVHVICLKKGTYHFPSHVHVYSLGKEEGENRVKYLWRFYTYFGHVFFHVRVRYVFFHMGAIFNILAAPFFMLRMFFGTKFLWWKAHGHINRSGHIAGWFCDEIVTSTESGYPIAVAKRRIVGQAIDTHLFTTNETIKRNMRQVLFVGRISEAKHLETFIAVAKRLESRGYAFVIVGPVLDETYYRLLQQQAKSTHISWYGPKTQTELVALYQNSGIFLNTSLTHSMDKTVLEAILCGCVPVTANRAFRELLEPHNLYLEEPDEERYVNNILQLEKVDTHAVRTTLQKTVREQHSLDTFTERIFHVG